MTAITVIVVGTQTCTVNKEQNNAPPAFGDFAGSDKCVSCHATLSTSFFHTGHYLTTRPAKAEYILGSFAKDSNVYRYDSSHQVVMESRDSGFYQVGYYLGQQRVIRRFDIVVGSGAKGQTYITRNDSELYQLPVSYFTNAHQWANSPLYPKSPVLFNRPITSRCLECHSTFITKLSVSETPPEAFNPDQMIYGVDCEKCHGPAARHVAFHTRNPDEKLARFIVNPAGFTRQQSLESCALCHGGRLEKTKPSFTYVPGAPLADYFVVDTTTPDPQTIDVHGNQYGLLRNSKCFRLSPAMTCTTCHDPHTNQRSDLAGFSRRCMSCHNPTHGSVCGLLTTVGEGIKANCIDCHMPLKPSQSITELLPGHNTPTAALIRSHLISIYPNN
jgi:Cytochrome c554 and c-prime